MPERPIESTPFSPPPDYEFEPELVGEVPRPIPDEARQGRYARSFRQSIYTLMWIACFSFVLAPLPFVKEVGQYFVPCEYLRWIGIGSLLIAAGVFVYGRLFTGRYRYIREGVPLLARVVSLVKTPSLIVHGNPSQFVIVAFVEFRDPYSGQMWMSEAKSSPFSAIMRSEYTTSFRVGDYVTGVYLPGDLQRSLRLYSFLDLMPNVGLIKRSEPDSERDYLWKIPLLFVSIILLLCLAAGNIIAWGRYQPVSFGLAEGKTPFIYGASVFGCAFLVGDFYFRRYRQRRRHLQHAALAAGEALEVDPTPASSGEGRLNWAGRLFVSLGAAMGAAVIGGLTGVCWAFSLNALLDRSPPQNQPAQIREMVVVTHELIVREYRLKYTLGGWETHSLLTTPEHLASFQRNDGIAEIHAGYFGWPWVKTIHPVDPPRGK
jgi:hypothetical protein